MGALKKLYLRAPEDLIWHCPLLPWFRGTPVEEH